MQHADNPLAMNLSKGSEKMAATKEPKSITPSPIESNVTFRMVDLCRLIERYMTEEDSKKVYSAFILAAEAHDGVARKSGEPYVTHPLEVARILADLHLDADSLCAALLHDVIEDTEYSYNDIARQFGETVANLVEGVTKLSTSDFKNKQEAGIASFQKMMQAMVKDYRVVLIKLADRLHNVSTLGSMPPSKQRRIAKETLEIHAPLARRMGMNALRHALQMHAFQSLYPNRSKVISKWWNGCLAKKEETHTSIISHLQETLDNNGIRSSTVFHREKNLYRLYEKEKKRKLPITFNRSDISYDIRILTRDVSDCYRALGIVHQLYLPKSGELKDFISVPKVYGFQALQTTVVTKEQDLIQIQIQSREMHQVAQYGITAQWRFPCLSEQHRVDIAQRRLSTWLAQVKEIQDATESPEEFLEDMKADFFLQEVSVMTPKGDSKILRSGATPVDFAYAIHTDIGQHCIAALIDGRKTPLNTPLHDGAMVQIITDQSASPRPSWLNFVVTGKARSAIRSWISSRKADEFITLGKELLTTTLANFNTSLEQIDPAKLKQLLSTLDLANENKLFSEIAKGNQCSKLVTRRLLDDTDLQTNDTEKPFYIKGAKGLTVQLAKCCHPIPNDRIIANIAPDIGLQVHRSDCTTLKHLSAKDKMITSWDSDDSSEYFVPLQIFANNKIGVLSGITDILKQASTNIEDINIYGDRDRKELRILIKVKDNKQLQTLIHSLLTEPAVNEVSRLFKLSSGIKI